MNPEAELTSRLPRPHLPPPDRLAFFPQFIDVQRSSN
jgi:hypothetical protein